VKHNPGLNPFAHKARKRFGQNFLQDPYIIDRIVNAVNPKPSQKIVEIGPGLGALTTELLPLCHEMDAIELDRDIIPKLRVSCATLGKLTIHESDVLKFDFRQLYTDNTRLKLVGNLPYNISTPIMFHILKYADIISEMIFMVQKEVAERITAQPGSRDYGRLSIMLQYHCETQYLFLVPPHAFIPAPKVDSAIIRMVPYATPPYKAENETLFAGLVAQAFSQRRKTLRNTLKTMVDNELWQTIDIDPSLRPEMITVEQFVKLSNALSA
jgi:16S rRNA (adenine1518-N6/adenine1519-N6)-dimethyltransferase